MFSKSLNNAAAVIGYVWADCAMGSAVRRLRFSHLCPQIRSCWPPPGWGSFILLCVYLRCHLEWDVVSLMVSLMIQYYTCGFDLSVLQQGSEYLERELFYHTRNFSPTSFMFQTVTFREKLREGSKWSKWFPSPDCRFVRQFWNNLNNLETAGPAADSQGSPPALSANRSRSLRLLQISIMITGAK